MTPEGRVKAKVTKLLKAYAPSTWYYMPVQTGMGKAVLDYVGASNGRAFAVETKKPGGKPTARQVLTMEEMRRAGIQVFIVSTDEELATLKMWLDVTKHWIPINEPRGTDLAQSQGGDRPGADGPPEPIPPR